MGRHRYLLQCFIFLVCYSCHSLTHFKNTHCFLPICPCQSESLLPCQIMHSFIQLTDTYGALSHSQKWTKLRIEANVFPTLQKLPFHRSSHHVSLRTSIQTSREMTFSCFSVTEAWWGHFLASTFLFWLFFQGPEAMPFGPFLSPPGERLEASSQAFLPDSQGGHGRRVLLECLEGDEVPYINKRDHSYLPGGDGGVLTTAEQIYLSLGVSLQSWGLLNKSPFVRAAVNQRT